MWWPKRDKTAVVVVTLAVFLLAACTVGPSRSIPLVVSGPGSAPTTDDSDAHASPSAPPPATTLPPLMWGPCPIADNNSAAEPDFMVDCAHLDVPISHQAPERGTMSLAISRALAPEVAHDAPALIILRGEPAQWSYLQVKTLAHTLPVEITEHFAIVTLDMRGVGDSTGIMCVDEDVRTQFMTFPADPASDTGAQELAALTRQLTFDCGDLVGPGLTQMNSTNAAGDLDMLRAALQQSQLTMVASGFGATIGAVYADLFPHQVGRLVLDSPRDPLAPPVRVAQDNALAAEAQLTNFLAACPQFLQGCPLGDSPERALHDALGQLPNDGTFTVEWLTRGAAHIVLWRLLPYQGTWPVLADALAAIEFDHGRRLAALWSESFGGAHVGEQLTGHLLFYCNDSAARLSEEEIAAAAAAAAEQAPVFGRSLVAWQALCTSWPAPDNELTRLTAAEAGSLLLIGSTQNAQYPFSGVRAINAQLSSATLLTWQSPLVGAYPESTCIASVVNEYLLDGAVPGQGILCPR